MKFNLFNYFYNIRYIVNVQMSYKIVKLDMFFVARNKDFKNSNGVCELCKCSLHTGGPVEVGKCHHAFHVSCIKKIGAVSCPIDHTMWSRDYILPSHSI